MCGTLLTYRGTSSGACSVTPRGGVFCAIAGGDVVQSAGTTAIVLLEVWRREHSRAQLGLGLEVKILNNWRHIYSIADHYCADAMGAIVRAPRAAEPTGYTTYGVPQSAPAYRDRRYLRSWWRQYGKSCKGVWWVSWSVTFD